MPIPIVTMPQQGPVAGRPRREALYDTEGWVGGSAIGAKITIFRNATAFTPPSGTLGLSKTKGRDHNFDNNGGQLAKNQMLHWYSWTQKIRSLAAVLTGAAVQGQFDLIRRISEGTWSTFKFGGVPYISVPTYQIPFGVGHGRVHTTHNAQTVMNPAPQELERLNAYDVSLAGLPVEIGEQETFSEEIESNGVTPTPAVDTYSTSSLRGVFLKGIQG